MSSGIEILNQKDFFKNKSILELGGGIGNNTIRMLKGISRSIVTTELEKARSEATRNKVNQTFADPQPLNT